MSNLESKLRTLYTDYSGNTPETITALPASGSDRTYFRIKENNQTVIGAYNDLVRENEAFFYFSKHFETHQLPVPHILSIDESRKAYIQTDLGDNSLFSLLSLEGISSDIKEHYLEVVRWLPEFQIKGIKGLDLSYCYPRHHFDKQSMMWDFNYFKYYFARLTGVIFDEQALEDDFETLASFLEEADSRYFMFRDFQSRNIMINGGKPYFIDYQGGRSGPLQYDLASLLYDAKANLSVEFRNELLDEYLKHLESYYSENHDNKLIEDDQNDYHHNITRDTFLKYFDGFVLMRILQALGAYGFRGYYQKKVHFLQSIPYALNNLKYLFAQKSFNIDLPELRKLLENCMEDEKLLKLAPVKLNVRVTSFSYKHGIPSDMTGNGGGFVFDCRALPNPGRLVEFKTQSGLDESVITYLNEYSEVKSFIESVYSLVDQSVNNYTERGFQNLMINFGCTGGRHRSVYCAEKLVFHLNQKFSMTIKPEHSEKSNW